MQSEQGPSGVLEEQKTKHSLECVEWHLYKTWLY